MFVNEIKHKFCTIFEIVEEDAFSAGPLKAYIFYPNPFLYVLPKKPGYKHLLATHDDCFMFKTFFSLVNNKGFLFCLVIHPNTYTLIHVDQSPMSPSILYSYTTYTSCVIFHSWWVSRMLHFVVYVYESKYSVLCRKIPVSTINAVRKKSETK